MKADASRDYYADLDVSPDCSEEDIKKQYRKLALLFHPDRNHGKEAEAIERFQAVQAAHDILADPEQRAKYDQARRRGTIHTSFERPAGPRGRAPPKKPPPDATNFPPPPRRAGPPRQDAPPSGAERYANFAPPPRREPAAARGSDAKDRANMFNAWKQMNNHAKAQQSTPRPPPTQPGPRTQPPPPPPPRFKPGHSPQDAYPPNVPPRREEPPPPRSAYEQMNRQRPVPPRHASSFEGQKRTTGYDPHSPGDENPVTNPTMYTNSQRYDRANPPRMANGFPTPRPAPTAKKPDTAQTPYTAEPRERAPYTVHTNEKTYFSTESLRRTASQREAPNLRPAEQTTRGVSFQEPPPQGRRKSSSPPRKQTVDDYQPARSAPHSPHRHPYEEINTQSQSDQSRQGFFVYSSSNESETSSSPTGDFSTARRHSSQHTGVPASGDDQQRSTSDRPKAQPSSSWTNRSAQEQAARSKSMEESAERPDQAIPNQDVDAASAASTRLNTGFDDVSNSSGASSPKPPMPRRAATTYGFATSQRTDIHNSSSNPEIRFRKSENNINTRFSQRYGSETVDSTGNLPRTESHPNMFEAQSQNSRGPYQTTSPTSQSRAPQASPMPPPPRSAPGAAPGAPLSGSSQSAPFHADHWSKAMQEENWASKWANPSPSVPSTSPTRPNTARQRASRSSNSQRVSMFPQAATVQDQDDAEAGLAGPSPIGEAAIDDDDDLMDIDDESLSPRNTRNTPQTSTFDTGETIQGPTARPVFQETNRLEWRDGFGATEGGLEPPPNVERRHSHPINSTSPKVPSPQQRPVSNITMDDFRHVTPFSSNTGGAGLGDMRDMSSELPFKSKPSDIPPTRLRPTTDADGISNATSNLNLPKPPRAPLPPSKHSDNLWKQYLSEMRNYMHAWNAFNSTMSSILGARAQEFIDMERGPEGGMVNDWLGVVGETKDLGGWDTYTRKLKEEEKCRMHWNVAAERHRDAVQRHERLRRSVMNEWVRRGVS